MKKTDAYDEVLTGFAELCGDPEMADRVRVDIARRAPVDALQSARCRLGLGLYYFARRMGIPRGELVRIEEGTDADLSQNQLGAYVRAVVAAVVERAPATPKAAKPRAAVPKRTAREKTSALA